MLFIWVVVDVGNKYSKVVNIEVDAKLADYFDAQWCDSRVIEVQHDEDFDVGKVETLVGDDDDVAQVLLGVEQLRHS